MVQWKRCRWRKGLSHTHSITHTHTHTLLTAPADGKVGCSHTPRHGYPQISSHTPTHTLTCVSHSDRPCGIGQPLLLLTHTYTQKKRHLYVKRMVKKIRRDVFKMSILCCIDSNIKVQIYFIVYYVAFARLIQRHYEK